MTERPRPAEDLARVAAAQLRFDEVVAAIDDTTARRPSALPGWTVGHVLSHVARNADSHVRRAEAATRGEVVEQYAGGYAGRAAEIEAGAGRSSRELAEDVRASGERLMAAWLALPDEAWDRMTLDVSGGGSAASARWSVDGGRSSRFTSSISVLARPTATGHPRSLPPSCLGDAVPPSERTGGSSCRRARSFRDDREELAWLYGRVQRPDLPRLAAL